MRGSAELIPAPDWADIGYWGARKDETPKWSKIRLNRSDVLRVWPAKGKDAVGANLVDEARVGGDGNQPLPQEAFRSKELLGEVLHASLGQIPNGPAPNVCLSAPTPKYHPATKKMSFLIWHRDFVASWPDDEPVPTEREIVKKARQRFGGHISRDWIREARRAAPEHWHVRGRKSRRK